MVGTLGRQIEIQLVVLRVLYLCVAAVIGICVRSPCCGRAVRLSLVFVNWYIMLQRVWEAVVWSEIDVG